MISVLEAKRLLQKGCEAYLAHVIDTSTLKVTLGSVPIVREFSNVFSKDLPRFPSNRELEFCIDLLPRTAPISIPPYRMAPAKLKELKTQLQDLVERVSSNRVSPWDAPVLFVKKNDGTIQLCIDY